MKNIKNSEQKKKKAFTLIEVLVVIAVIGLVLPALFSSVFSVLKQQVQLYYLTETKRQGDAALSTMENLIRPVVKISSDSLGATQKCLTPERYPSSGYSDGGGVNPIYFTDKNNNIFQFYKSGNILKYKLGATESNLNSSKVNVTSFQLACQRKTTYSPPTLYLIFTVQYINNPNTSLTYRTRVVLRND
jgi:prepilin-type N-terminal cleavage/methylation domain-containing protein